MKVTLDNLQDIGKGVQEEFNSLIEILDENIVERKLRIGNTEISTNVPVKNMQEFEEIIDRIGQIGCSVEILKCQQLFNTNRVSIIEQSIYCYRNMLKNLKTIRFDLYAKREDVSKNIYVTGTLKFDREKAEQYVTRYIHALYERISNLRKDLLNMREGEIIDFDESVFNRNDLLAKENIHNPPENEKSTVDSNPSN